MRDQGRLKLLIKKGIINHIKDPAECEQDIFYFPMFVYVPLFSTKSATHTGISKGRLKFLKVLNIFCHCLSSVSFKFSEHQKTQCFAYIAIAGCTSNKIIKHFFILQWTMGFHAGALFLAGSAI